MIHPKTMVFGLILLFSSLPQIATDIYMPSLPIMALAFNTSIHALQWSVSLYIAGLFISQSVYGVLSEGLGRRPSLLAGLVILLIGSCLCSSATSIEWLMAGRAIQGLGAGSCSVLWRSIFRDTFAGRQFSQYAAYLTLVVTFVLPAAPLLGGYLQNALGFRSTFVFLSLYCLGVIILIFRYFQETNVHRHRDKLKKSFILKTVKTVLSNPLFMGYCCCTFLMYMALCAWVVTGPVLLIVHLKMSPVAFSWVSCITVGTGMACSTLLINVVFKRCQSTTLLRIGWALSFCAGFLLLVLHAIGPMSVLSIAIPVFVFYCGVFLIFPQLFFKAFEFMASVAGYAGAIYSSMQMAGGAFITALIPLLPGDNPVTLAGIYITSCTIAWLYFECCVRPIASKES